MADKSRIVQEILATVKNELIELGSQVRAHDAWGLNLPVGVIDARKGSSPTFHVCSVGSIGNVLKISTTVDDPLMQQLFQIYQDKGEEEALNEMMNGENAEEFSQIFSEYQTERKSGKLVWGASDASAFVVKSKDCYSDGEVALVIMHTENGRDALITCGVPWSL